MRILQRKSLPGVPAPFQRSILSPFQKSTARHPCLKSNHSKPLFIVHQFFDIPKLLLGKRINSDKI